MASRSGRRPPATPPRARRRKGAAGVGSAAAAAADRDEIIARAARLGITPERVLQEYARIAFADLRRIADWGPNGLVPKTPEALSDADAAAIAEIVSGRAGADCRIRLYDKKAALDALARHLGMFARAAPRAEEAPQAGAEDAREVLARRLARLAAGSVEE